MKWETERLQLRPLVMEDLDALYRLYSHPAVMQYIAGSGKPRSYEATRLRLLKHLVDFEHYGWGLYATLLKATGEIIGRCGLEPVEGKEGLEGDIAWMFLPP